MVTLATKTKVLAVLHDMKNRGSIKETEETEFINKISEIAVCNKMQKKKPA